MRHHLISLLLAIAITLLASCGDDAASGALSDAPNEDAGSSDTATSSDTSDDTTPLADDDARGALDAEPDTTAEDAAPTDASPNDAAPDLDAPDAAIEDALADVPADAPADTEVVDAATDADTDQPDAPVADAETDTPDPPPLERTCGLLVNADAESDNLDGWTIVEGDFRTVEGSFLGGLPDAYQGTFSFAAGSVPRAVLVQEIDVGAWGEAIDAGPVYARFGGFVRDWNGNDGASLRLSARSDVGDELGAVEGGPWYADTWTARGLELLLPSGTRSLEVALIGDRERGNDNDAYFDALTLCVDPEPTPAAVDELTAPPYLMWSKQEGATVLFETEGAALGRVDYGPTPELGMVLEEEVPGRAHELRMSGLPGDQEVFYQVSWGGGPLPPRSFRTAPDPSSDAPFTFVVWGDNQNGPDNFRALIPHMVDEAPAFAVNTGDCVQNGTRREYREQLFDPISPLADHVPFLVGAGNHERQRDADADLFDEVMAQPGDEHCFGWRWGAVFFMFIDTELDIDPDSPQGQCIQDALSSDEATSAPFRAAVFHKPPRIEWWVGGPLGFWESLEAPQVRETLEPLLESLDVDLVFNGHNHLYAHTPETPGGITWVTTGGGGGSLDTDAGIWRVGTWPEIETTIHEHHFLSVRVEGDQMVVRAIGLDGGMLHEFVVSAD